MCAIGLVLAGTGRSNRRAFRRASDLYAAGRWDEAAAAFGRIAERPDAAGRAARFNRGLALYQAGRFTRARTVFERLTEDASPVIQARALFSAGNCAWRVGDAAAAASRWRGCVEQTDAALARRAAGSDADVLREVRRRALHNLASAQAPAEPRGAASSTDGRRAKAQAGDPSAAVDPAAPAPAHDSTAGGKPGGADESEEGARGGPAEVLADVRARDGGPQISRAGLRAAPTERDW